MKKIEVPASVVEVIDFVTCDLCGARIIGARGHNIDEVEIRYRIGSENPECGSGQETSVDMCGKCFNEKLKPWLRSQGADPRTEDWDW